MLPAGLVQWLPSSQTASQPAPTPRAPVQVLHLLCRGSLQLQASLLAGSAQKAALESTNASLAAAMGLMDRMVTPGGAALPGVLPLRVHHNILYVSMALASGQITSIRQGEEEAAVQEQGHASLQAAL